MVESYSKNANHNMRRPVVKEEIVSFMRERQAPVTDALKELEEFLLMAEQVPDAKIMTIDRNEEMIGFAKENFARFDQRKQITLLEGDAVDLLEHIEQRFDLIFMDSAKSKYIVFLPEVLKRLEVGGVVILDDIFQGGDVARDIMDVRRGQRTIYRGLQRLFDATLDHPGLTASLIPLGDGILMIRKNLEEISLPTEE